MNRLSIFFLLLFSCCHLPCGAQSPYQLSFKKEASIIGAGLGLGGGAYLLHRQLKPLTFAEIKRYQGRGIHPLEEWATSGRRSTTPNTASDVLLYSAQLVPGILVLADPSMRKDFLKIGTLCSEVFLVNLGTTAFVKNAVRRTRPFVYDEGAPLEEQMTKSARTSFYSGHTSGTAAMCFLTARLYADYHPESKWKPMVWTAAAVLPAVAGILRMRAGKHFPSDVAAGYAMGAATGYFLPVLHKRIRKAY